MSLTLATVADALIEFILSLLRDPDVAAEFDQDPDQALAARGLQHASPQDVAAVAPIIIERTHVVQVAAPRQVSHDHPNPVVREIKQVTTHNQWVDDRDTIVDQSVNQNIWAEGDVTQTFDNDAIVASGDDAVAAGGDAVVDRTTDLSTHIEAGEDVNIGNETDVQVVEDSFNEQLDESVTNVAPIIEVIEDSFGDDSTDVDIVDSGNETTTETQDTQQVIDVQVVDDSGAVEQSTEQQSQTEQQPVEQPAQEQVEQPVEEPVAEPVETYDAAVEYVETAIEDETGLDLGLDDALAGAEGETDENF